MFFLHSISNVHNNAPFIFLHHNSQEIVNTDQEKWRFLPSTSILQHVGELHRNSHINGNIMTVLLWAISYTAD